MKEKRKFYHPIPDDNFTIQGTKLEIVGILIVGLIVALYFGYKHYVQPPPKPAPPKPVEVEQVGSTRQKEITRC
ncbi:hypothetical protein F4Z98_04030 [Candidatus Poribacteria bacterium]|nr:hypothetical protein [Candidatus Poribacteria bacterium]